MPLLTTREVILVKEEVTYNTDSLPVAATDAVQIGNPSWGHEGLRMIERNIVKNTDGMKQQIYGGTLKTVSFDVELKGSGTAGVAPEFGKLFEFCSMAETIAVGVSVSYQLSSDSADKKSCTIYYYQDGLLHKVTGCRGTFTMNIETGAIPMASFTFTGHSEAIIDAALPSPTLDATDPHAVRGNAFVVDGFSAAINALAVDIGSNVITPTSMSASDGFGEIFNGKRDVNGSFDPQAELVADEDFYGNFTSGALMSMTTGTIGTTAGNIVQIDLDNVYYRDIAPGDRDTIRTFEIPFGATESAGDDELTITFT